MKISAINFNFKNSKNINKIPFQNKNAQERTPFQGANHLSNLNSLFLASNISFGNNVKIIEQMKKEKNIEKRKELFNDLTQKAQDSVNGVVEHEKLKDKNGEPILTLKEYLHACVRQPSLFHQSPDTIADHIKALLFINKDRLYFKTGEIDKNTLVKNTLRATLFIACTNDLNYSFLLREKMFLSHDIKGVGGNEKVRAKLKQYLQNNPNEKFTFSIIKDEKSDEFIEFAKKFAKEATGRDDVFNIHCVEMV